MKRSIYFLAPFLILSIFMFAKKGTTEVASTYTYIPPFITNSVPPMVMLTMARDHRLYYEAYNDASDINGDGILDVRYNPEIDYYGYFDSYKYYEYVTTDNGRFEPRGTTTTDKKIPSALIASKLYWSGDFLNYVTMTRMDCLRKVLYGGYRSKDTATETVLERAFIPQDAHSFGKEYESIARDGFDIREYTPLDLPVANRRHLIATTALGNYNPTASPPTGLPLLRVLNDSTARIWEWVATERPVVKSNFGGSTVHPGHPNTKAEFDTMVASYATETRKFGTGNLTTINGSGNPFGNNDNYLTLISGVLAVDTPGTYRFAIRGDDAIDFRINGGAWFNPYAVTMTGDTIGWYGAHGQGSIGAHWADITLAAGNYTIEYRHEEAGGSDTYRLHWHNGTAWQVVPQKLTTNSMGLSNLTITTYNLVTNAVITDHVIRVQVGVSGLPESNSKRYPSGTYKPIGLLQRHGENDRMYFGLMTGSYTRNLSGGVLRQPVGSIRQEINANTGEFLYQDNSSVGGIVRTLDKLRIYGFRNVNDFDYNDNCGWIVTAPLAEGQCRMWGNPMAEMMYESARYFAGSSSPTSAFVYSGTSNDDHNLGLPLAAWNNPYNSTNYCAKPIMLAISDIYPSYDSDQLPGSAWPTTITGNPFTGLNVNTKLQNIANHEGVNGSFYIGQHGAPGDTGYDGACTPKSILGLQNSRGLCPEEPSKQGSYYSAAVTHHAATTNLIALNPNATVRDTDGNQTMVSYMVALSSPLPEIKIPVGGNVITMVPFGKSVGGWSGLSPTSAFQPTNTIVDFFVEELTPTTGTFRVNFEDVEQGADHDMDAIVRYHYEVVDNSTVDITLTSEYAAGSIIQHMGYIISGTTADRTYLVVRDFDTAAANDPDYHLDYPNTPGVALPLESTITFTPGTTPGANLLKNPLWYAAKWGGFEDSNNNGIPDLQSEWDKDNDGVPDTYFFVANPTKLEEQLNKAFADILRRTASGTAAAVISQSRTGIGALYQAIFYPEYKDAFSHTINWAGQVHSFFVDSRSNLREDTNQNSQLDTTDKYIVFEDINILRFTDTNGDGRLSEAERNATVELLTNSQQINYIWTSSNWLNNIDNADVVAQRSQYNATTQNRYIFTFVDMNSNMINDKMFTPVVVNDEIQDFVWPPNSPVATPNSNLSNSTDFYAYLTLYPSFEHTPTAISNLRSSNATGFGSLLWELARRQVDFIRGADQGATAVAGLSLNATRSRTYGLTASQDLTWRLGDIVYSTPTVVARPAENYDLLYLDRTYEDFFKQYRNRRQMVYVGANDGMIHAFNGGFYNSTRNGFDVDSSGKAAFQLGMEVWAYVPYNLLPHLYWLTDSSYGSQLHVSYVDLKPRVFDARIFFQSDGVTPIDNDHPHGWGTVMVVGMRLGGGSIRADLDKTDGNGFDAAKDKTMSSAYVVMDITNPEKPPTVLAEINLPDQGFTTSYPTPMPMTTANTNSTAANQWYLVFGSGPANSAGDADPALLQTETSAQNGKLFILDLKSLVANKSLMTLDATGQFTNAKSYFATTEHGSFIADPVAVDIDLGSNNASAEFKADIIYYGTVSGDQVTGRGTMRRLITNNELASSGIVNWTGNSTLINVDKPVTSAPSVAMDENKRLWVYFGTGRFYNRDDIPQTEHMSFYGVREPESGWGTVAATDLYNSTQITITNGTCTGGVYTRDCVQVYKSGTLLTGGWNALQAEVDSHSGWRQDFTHGLARVLGQSAVLGGAVFFTAYMPSLDPCEFEGTSSLWGLFYKTGTAYYKPIFRNGNSPFSTSVDLGRGLAISPSFHSGVGDPRLFVPKSGGEILFEDPDLPFSTKSKSLFWLKCQDN